MNPKSNQFACSSILWIAAILLGLTIIGCEKERKEKVIDIKAPGVSIEVERGENSADVKIDTDHRDRN